LDARYADTGETTAIPGTRTRFARERVASGLLEGSLVMRAFLTIVAMALLSIGVLAACDDVDLRGEGTTADDDVEVTDDTADDTGAARTDDTGDVTTQAAGEYADEEGLEHVAGTLEVTLTQYEIEIDGEVQAGIVVFELTNEGDEAHGISIQPADAEGVILGTTSVEPGETEQMEIELEAGDYIVFCPIDDHQTEHDMVTELTVQ
jgi:uncharacterized cupredoxin-like copper-binding protein